MGCSIGGRIVLNLAIEHASNFRALIGLEAADFQTPWYDTSWLNRPDVHGGEVCAALVSGLIAPQSPKATRDETLWAYKQGGPGVFKGDLYFYKIDNDIRGRFNRGEPTVTWVGHATLLFQLDGVNVLTDPQWSERGSPLSFAGDRSCGARARRRRLGWGWTGDGD